MRLAMRAYRRAAVVLSVFAAVFGSVAVGPALAGPASGVTVRGGVSIEVSTPAAGKLASPAKQQKRPGESWQQFQQRLRKPSVSLADARAEIEGKRNFHDVRADPFKVAAGYPGEDWVTKEECRDAFAKQQFDGGWWYKNHYSACQVATVVFNAYECNRDCRWVGSTTARMTIVGRGSHTKRVFDWDVYLDNFRLSWGKEYGYLRYTINVQCDTFQDDQGKCDQTPATGVMRSLAQWRADGWAPFHAETSTGPQSPDFPFAQEQRSYFRYTPMVSNFEAGDAAPTPWTLGRCDNASYITGAGCMFPGTAGILHYDYKDESYKQSAQFFYDAMHHLDQVMPNSVGLYVPGGYFRQPLASDSYVPLHRNYYGNRSRTKVVAKCVELHGADYTKGPNGEKMECDEYPFSSTYENANYDDVGTAATWAVKPVLAEHNSKTGRILGDFYANDHILDSDMFYVAIDNAPTS